MPDIPRLSPKEYAVLDLLRSGREMYGLALVKASDGKLKRGTIYVLLSRMTEKGYVKSYAESKPDRSGLARRIYSVTGHGQQMLRSHDAAKTAAAAAWGIQRILA